MQTFLPYGDFTASVRCLDRLRLGKQRVEAAQILRILHGHSTGWKNHPAILMWVGYEAALAQYTNIVIDEWIRRGYRNTMVQYHVMDVRYPWWFGLNEFHASHRARLLDKLPEHYCQFGWIEQPSTEYWWPTKHQVR